MKSFIIPFINSMLLFTAVACNQNNQNSSASVTDSVKTVSIKSDSAAENLSLPAIEFNDEKHDFGNITAGEKVSYSVSFKNAGSSDLLIASAQGSCGCTVPSFPKEPIKPGQTGLIDVVFNSEGKSGIVEKTVTLITNCQPSTKILTISATIESIKK